MSTCEILAAVILSLFWFPGLLRADSPAAFPVHRDWTWVQGCVFVPTNCVNSAQQWDEYDPAINDRELHLASLYGINTVRVFLHYDIYLKDKVRLLANIEDFLTRADKYGIKTEFVFFDDCWTQPPKNLLSPDYKYPAPIPGVHNSRWVVSPGEEVRKHYEQNKASLKAYVQDIVSAHKADGRIIFWETYNEPGKSPETIRLMRDAQQWVHETGTAIPVTATGFPTHSGTPYSDFLSWHKYDNYNLPADRFALNTECMNRQAQSVPGIIQHWKGKTGFIMWEFGIGRDNCRFTWGDKPESPAKSEPKVPFHGLVYPDGHPWSIDDIKALMGEDAFRKLPLFTAEYFKDDHFAELAKTSITPFIDFDLPDEPGAGSPDASAGVPYQHFSIRYTGVIASPASSPASLLATADAGSRLKITIDGQPLIDRPTGGPQRSSARWPANSPAKIVVEYAHSTGPVSLHLTWGAKGGGRPLTPADPGTRP